MVTITGKVLRILPFKELTDTSTNTSTSISTSTSITKKVVDLIIADEFDYTRVSFWDEKAELIRGGDIKINDLLRIENASISRADAQVEIGGEKQKRANAGKYARISRLVENKNMNININPLRHANATVKQVKLTVLAVARPEKGQVCIAGITGDGEWIRPQGIYEADMDTSGTGIKTGTGIQPFKNLAVSAVYLDRWLGRHERKEDRFFVYTRGVEKELDDTEKRAFLDRYLDASVDEVFKRGRTLGLIKPRIMQVYEEKKRRHRHRQRQRQKQTEKEDSSSDQDHEQYKYSYIRFSFKDGSGRVYRRWSCRCDSFYKTWNAMKTRHRWTYSWRMHRYLKKNETYLAIGLTHSDYGVTRLEYGAFPMIVGVHVLQKP